MDKQADFAQMVAAAADPVVRKFMTSQGLIPGDFNPTRNFYDVMQDHKYRDELNEALHGASQQDRPAWERLMKGFATLGGTKWTPELQQHVGTLSGDIAKLSPHLMRWAPDVWDDLHGSRGSVAALTHAIAEANRRNPYFTPQNAFDQAREVHRQMYSDPMKHRGFSSRDLGKIYSEAHRRGLVSTANPQGAVRDLTALAGPLSAVRDSVGNGSTSDYFNVMHSLTPRGTMQDYGDLETRIRMGTSLGRQGGPFMASHQLYGDYNPGSGQADPQRAAAQHAQLTQQAAESPAANMLGATRRIAQEIGLQPGSPGEKFMNDAMAGNMPNIGTNEWAQMMQASGVSPGTASALLRQTARNRRYVDPETADVVRRAQYTWDISPQMSSGRTPQQQEIARGDNDALATRLGYDSLENMQQLHGPVLGGVKGVTDRARTDANKARQTSHLGQAPWLSRTIDAVGDANPNTSLGHILGRSFGGVPTERVPPGVLKTSEDQGSDLFDDFQRWMLEQQQLQVLGQMIAQGKELPSVIRPKAALSNALPTIKRSSLACIPPMVEYSVKLSSDKVLELMEDEEIVYETF
jgi:hypothetical protein